MKRATHDTGIRSHHFIELNVRCRRNIWMDGTMDGYPTNMLILPDGKRCVRASQVTELFFENYVK